MAKRYKGRMTPMRLGWRASAHINAGELRAELAALIDAAAAAVRCMAAYDVDDHPADFDGLQQAMARTAKALRKFEAPAVAAYVLSIADERVGSSASGAEGGE